MFRAACVAYVFCLPCAIVPLFYLLEGDYWAVSGSLAILAGAVKFSWLVAAGNRAAALVLAVAVVVLAVVGVVMPLDLSGPSGRDVMREAMGMPPDPSGDVPRWFIFLMSAVICYFPIAGVRTAFREREHFVSPAAASARRWRWLPVPVREAPRILLTPHGLRAAGYLALAAVLWVVGFGVLAVTAILGFLASGVVGFIGLAILYVLARFAGWLYVTGRRHVAACVAEWQRRDPRPPVLLLRSFRDDQISIQRKFVWSKLFGNRRPYTLEEAIAAEMAHFGPVVAIGRPGEALPPLGAIREYVSEADWKERVQEYVSKAAVIVAVLGSSEGLRWEWENIVGSGNLAKLVMIVPTLVESEIFHRADVLSAGIGALQPLRSVAAAVPTTLVACRFGETGLDRVVTCSVRDEEAYRMALSTLA